MEFIRADADDVTEAVLLLEEEFGGKDVSWNISKITNTAHAIDPIGQGFFVTLRGALPNKDEAIWGKGGTVVDAVRDVRRKMDVLLRVLTKS